MSISLVENKRIIVLVDANNFFVSCERAFNPALNGRPVVVLSNNDGNVISRSTEAKQLGIKMGEVFYQRKHWYDQHGVSYFSSNYSVYSAKSQQVIEILSRYAKTLEYYSVDEAWLDLTEVGDEGIDDFCRELRLTLWKEAKIPCSFGIGRNKTQAKIAASMAKKQPSFKGVFNVIEKPQYQQLLASTPVKELWGINRRLSNRLQAIQINTAYDFAYANSTLILRKTNINVSKIQHELNGEFCFEFQTKAPLPKMISVSLSFAYETTREQDIQEATACYIARAAARLRQNKMAAKQVIVALNTNRYSQEQPFSVEHAEAQLKGYSIYTPDFIHMAQALVKDCYIPGRRYHKVTVILADLMPMEELQRSLFDQRQWDVMAMWMALADTLNERYGEGSFRFEGESSRPFWKVRRRYLSKATVENMGLKQIDRSRMPYCRMGTDSFLIESLSSF